MAASELVLDEPESVDAEKILEVEAQLETEGNYKCSRKLLHYFNQFYFICIKKLNFIFFKIVFTNLQFTINIFSFQNLK